MGNFLHDYSLVVSSGAADYMFPFVTSAFLDFLHVSFSYKTIKMSFFVKDF